jgi:hypothetical protein
MPTLEPLDAGDGLLEKRIRDFRGSGRRATASPWMSRQTVTG